MAVFAKVTIIGSGLMGQYISLVFAKAGSKVCMVDLNQDILDRAFGRIKNTLGVMRQFDEVHESDEAILSRITTDTDFRPHTPDSGLILEAIVEKAEVKRELYQSLMGHYGPSTVISSNTSVLNVFELMPQAMLPRAAMTHFFVPPHLVPLVEVVGSPVVEPDVLPALKESLTIAGMKPVFMKRFINGFIVNRLQRAYNREAFQLIEDSYADAATIDEAVKASIAIRFPVMGILGKNDQAGLDLVLNNIKAEELHLVNHENPPAVLERMVRAGELGCKSGKGFYDYSGLDPDVMARERDEKLIKIRRLMQEIGEL